MKLLVVLDLDYTVWHPEMNKLDGAPRFTRIDSEANRRLPPSVLEEAKTNRDGYILTDRSGEPMRVFKGASVVLSEIARMKRLGFDIEVAAASRTDEPDWAQLCLKHLVVDDQGNTVESYFKGNLVEVAHGYKANHFQRLHRKTGIPYEHMIFFDNEMHNIRSVEPLGVHCYCVPHGMTKEAWEKAKAKFGIDLNKYESDVSSDGTSREEQPILVTV